MVLGIGLISAFIIAKKNTKRTRLQILQQKLSNKPIKSLNLYQFPTKKLFIIFLLTCFIFFLGWFSTNFSNQLLTFNLKHGISTDENQKIQELENVIKVIHWVKLLNIVILITAISDLKMKTIRAKKDFNGLLIDEYSIFLFWKPKRSKISWKNKEQLRWQIIKIGNQKFTQNTGRYAIQLLNISDNRHFLVIERPDIFQTRKSLIQLGSIFNFKPDLKIH